ncbi:DeoR/GlpR family DNA-binding transcription regulator [Kosmotoga arenicorallina]|uniref:DeoR/GlpR family DNA-binding transcription regulator n=1 Tax=Kosmotoga arenicorallina TaxID=688066 RepID=UPI0029390132|nr:DeoR/GlpR family DNA-binding transcription regulator [Kosmotoga arenicorallina]
MFISGGIIIIFEERKNYIVEKLNKYGKIYSSSLAEELKISEVTVRSDLKKLENLGLLKRVHGGAISLKPHRYDPQFQEQIAVDVDEKKLIAEKAVQLVEKNDIIFIDSGSTTLFFTEKLLETPPLNLTVVTNSLYIINTVVQYPEIKLVVLGGYFQYSTMNFLDLEINPFFDRYHVNKAFMGINGLDESGYFSSTLLEAETKKLIVKASPEIYILASTSKLFKKSLVRIKGWSGTEVVITATKDENVMKRLKKCEQDGKFSII